MRCKNCQAVVAPGPDACPTCGGPVELGFLDIVRWSAVGVLRGVSTGRFSAIAVLIGAFLVGGLGFLGARAVFGPAPPIAAPQEPVSTIATMRAVPDAAAPAPVLVADETDILELVDPWRQVVGADVDDVGHAIARAANGDLIFVGRSANGPNDVFSDVLFVRTAADGALEDQAILSALAGSIDTSVGVSADGAIYVAGTDGLSVNIIRVSDAGDMEWGTSLSVSSLVGGVAVAASPVGDGVFVAAAGEEPGTVMVIDVDFEGREVWRRSVLASGLQGKIDLAAVPGGGVTLGFAAAASDGTIAPEVVRFDVSGEALWQYRFDDRTNASFAGLANARRGDVFVAGLTPPEGSFGDASLDGSPWLARLNDRGTMEWDADLSANIVSSPLAIAASSATGVHLAASVPVSNRENKDMWVARFDSEGAVMWDTVLQSPSIETVQDALITPGGDIVLVGSLSVPDVADRDVMMLRLGRGGVPPLGLSEDVARSSDTSAWRSGSASQITRPVSPIAEPEPADIKLAVAIEPDPVDEAPPEPEIVDDRPEPVSVVQASLSAAATDPVQLFAASRSSDPDPALEEPTVPEPAETETDVTEPAADPVAETASEPEPPVSVSLTCSFRCQTEDGVVKYPVSKTYEDLTPQERLDFALGLGAGESNAVCAASGGLAVPDTTPACD